MPRFTPINIDNWPRKKAFQFYKDFDDPYFNFTVNVDVTKLIANSKSRKESFFLHTLHACLIAANQIKNFKYRIEEGHPVIYSTIHGGSTVLYDDESFGFAYYSYYDSLSEFIQKANIEIEKRRTDKSFEPNKKGQDSGLIYFSSIPWFSFTSTKHANHHTINNSIPRISFGKYFSKGDTYMMPLSIEANHALMDGLHIGRFIEIFENIQQP